MDLDVLIMLGIVVLWASLIALWLIAIRKVVGLPHILLTLNHNGSESSKDSATGSLKKRPRV